MRAITERAEHLKLIDPRHAPFVAPRRSPASGCEPKAILKPVERYRTHRARPPWPPMTPVARRKQPARCSRRTKPACDYSSVTATPTPRRATCTRCLRPQATCLCALVRPTAHRTQVLVLQHPQEQRQAKNSVALLRLSLAQCEVVVGEHFAPAALQALLHRPGRHTRLLYPDVPAAPALPAPPVPDATADMPLRLVVLDATWRKSLRMLLEHPTLAALPRLALDAPEPTRYRAIRAARRADQVSTLEATVQALAMLEGPSFDAAPLLDAFGHFVTGVAAWQRPPASSRDATAQHHR